MNLGSVLSGCHKQEETDMKKQLANIISSSRILAAIILFLFSEITTAFLAIYIYCGFSDLIDGPIARKIGSVSVIGSVLDTVGDVVTYVAMVKIFFLNRMIPLWALVWFGVTLIAFIVSAVISKIKFDKFYFVHSLFGKILGVAIFLLPIGMLAVGNKVFLCIVCSVSSIASLEAVYIQLKSKKALTNVISLKNINK